MTINHTSIHMLVKYDLVSEIEMADTENVPPTSSSSRQKPVVKSVKSAKSKSVPSDRKKLQTLQPSGKNQKLLVSQSFLWQAV